MSIDQARYRNLTDFVEGKKTLWVNGVPFAITAMEVAYDPIRRARIEIKASALYLVDGAALTSAEDERERIAAWHEAGEPIPDAFKGGYADYIRAGLPGWEG